MKINTPKSRNHGISDLIRTYESGIFAKTFTIFYLIFVCMHRMIILLDISKLEIVLCCKLRTSGKNM